MLTTLTEPQKRLLAKNLHTAWSKYQTIFGEPPHGTLNQLNAMVEFLDATELIQSISKDAVFEHLLKDL